MTKSSAKVTYLKDYKVSDFLIEHVDLTFELDSRDTRVKTKLNISPNPASDASEKLLVLQGEKIGLHSVMLNGEVLDPGAYQLSDNDLIIKGINAPCVLELSNSINPELNTELSGLYISKNKFTTHCEAEGFRRITYFIDRPDVMATYTTTIIADNKQCPFMLSNGNLVEEGKTPDGRNFITWNDPFKKPSYLFALVAGDFDCVEDVYLTQSGRTIKLQFYVEKGLGERCHHAIESLKEAMLWDEVNYGRECDLDVYKVVAIDDFNMGAMENKGLNIFNTKAILALPSRVTDDRLVGIKGTVAHEYFHNWTGNRVTVRDWFQLTIKEGLTTFRNQSFITELCSRALRALYVNDLRSRQFPEDAGPLAHPVQPKSYIVPDNFYTSTIYKKGAELFQMLATLLGTEIFRMGMDLYFNRHDGEAVTIEHFLTAMHDVSNRDLSQFALWFHQVGTPEIEVEEHYIPEEQTYILTLKQSTKPTPNQPDKNPLVIPVRMGLISEEGTVIPLYLNSEEACSEQILMLTQPEERFEFRRVPSKPIVSLFRNFSAPVKINHLIAEEHYGILAKSDVDPFNRLEASQRYIVNQLEQVIKQVREGRVLSLSEQFIKTLDSIINSSETDLWLLADMLTIPSAHYLVDKLEHIDIEAMYLAREFLINEVAHQLQSSLMARYQSSNCSSQSSHFDIKEAGMRRLKNQCLSYLLHLKNPEVRQLAMKQFQDELAVNMTNTMAVLKGLNLLEKNDRELVLSQSLELWQDDSLAMDNWFSVQASSATTIDAIKTLMAHPKFDIKQPNKVTSVVGSFCENISIYHDGSGAGYQFLKEIILQLDKINPKVASDQVKYLANWRRFDPKRQENMKEALQTMLQHPISKRLLEMVEKSLGINELLKEQKITLSELPQRFFSQSTQNNTTPEPHVLTNTL